MLHFVHLYFPWIKRPTVESKNAPIIPANVRGIIRRLKSNKKAAIIAMQKLPIADPKVPRIEIAPEEPFSTALDENTSFGLDFDISIMKKRAKII